MRIFMVDLNVLAAILCDNQNFQNDNEKKNICIDNFNGNYI